MPRDAVWRGEVVRTRDLQERRCAGRVALRGHNLDGDAQADLARARRRRQGGLRLPERALRLLVRVARRRTRCPGARSARTSPPRGCSRPTCASATGSAVGSALLEVSQPRIPCSQARAAPRARGSAQALPRERPLRLLLPDHRSRASSRPATRSNARRPIRAGSRSPQVQSLARAKWRSRADPPRRRAPGARGGLARGSAQAALNDPRRTDGRGRGARGWRTVPGR